MRRVDHSAAKVSSVQALDGVFAALNLVELEINVTLGVWINSNVDNMSILLFGLGSDIFFELLDPILAFLSEVVSLVKSLKKKLEDR